MSTIAFTPMALSTTSRATTSRATTSRATTSRTTTSRTTAARSAAPRLRITRRGRLVLGALLAAPIAVVLAVSALSSPAQAGSTVSTASFAHITVAPGESLWELAAWIAPEADPRQVVSDLVSLNQLSTTEVQPGQRLAIPLEYAE